LTESLVLKIPKSLSIWGVLRTDEVLRVEAEEEEEDDDEDDEDADVDREEEEEIKEGL
jgi:hypothetical protein